MSGKVSYCGLGHKIPCSLVCNYKYFRGIYMPPYSSQIKVICSFRKIAFTYQITQQHSLNKNTIGIKKPPDSEAELTADTAMQSNYLLPVFH
jgi:hypothetical protein